LYQLYLREQDIRCSENISSCSSCVEVKSCKTCPLYWVSTTCGWKQSNVGTPAVWLSCQTYELRITGSFTI